MGQASVLNSLEKVLSSVSKGSEVFWKKVECSLDLALVSDFFFGENTFFFHK